jgi:uncharacterized protein (TIGR03437 family)
MLSPLSMVAIRVWLLLAGSFVRPCLFAQQPVFQPSGVLNGAGLAGGDQPAVALEMVVSIKGQNLAASTAIANTSPLPTTLANTSVTFNGSLAPLFYVSPTQINLQVPTAIRGARAVDIVVTTPAGSSDPVRVQLQSTAFGVFTQDATGCGPAAAFNIHSDGTLGLNTTRNSFDPDRDYGLAIFFTGLGGFVDRMDGTPWAYNPADNVAGALSISAWLGAPAIQATRPMNVKYAGPAPNQVGVDQINAVPFPGVQEGCGVPLYLTDFSSSASQLANVSIHTGGGACIDPPPTSLGLVTWQRNFTTDTGSSSSFEGVQIQFLQGNQLVFPPSPATVAMGCCAVDAVPSQSCQASLPLAVDAGVVTVSGVAANPIAIPPQNQNGQLGYQAQFLVGTLHGGTYQVSATGGGVAGAFNASAVIPPPITVGTDLSPGGTLTLPSKITWTGGDDRSSILVQIRVSQSGPIFELKSFVNASVGSADLPASYFQGPFGLPGSVPNGAVEIILTQQPANAPAPFNAPGLTLGVQQTWNYVWHFRGLKR